MGNNTSPGSFKFALDRPLRFAGVLIVLIMMVSIQAGSRSSDLFNDSMQNVNSLQGILRFGTENHIPVGIILNSQISLCNSPRNVSLKSVSIGTVMDRLLVASEYVWSMDEGVLMVRPRNLPESSSYVLNLKFERFTGMKSTIQGLGIILSGYNTASSAPRKVMQAIFCNRRILNRWGLWILAMRLLRRSLTTSCLLTVK